MRAYTVERADKLGKIISDRQAVCPLTKDSHSIDAIAIIIGHHDTALPHPRHPGAKLCRPVLLALQVAPLTHTAYQQKSQGKYGNKPEWGFLLCL